MLVRIRPWSAWTAFHCVAPWPEAGPGVAYATISHSASFRAAMPPRGVAPQKSVEDGYQSGRSSCWAAFTCRIALASPFLEATPVIHNPDGETGVWWIVERAGGQQCWLSWFSS